jgi:hypothetical protein
MQASEAQRGPDAYQIPMELYAPLLKVDPVRFVRITGVDPIELAKIGCTGGAEAEDSSDSRVPNAPLLPTEPPRFRP